jgi:hypothetical protein
MTIPVGMNSGHIHILIHLADLTECKYKPFRTEKKSWRRDSYFDGQIKRLSRKGLLFRTGSRTIQITNRGQAFVQEILEEVIMTHELLCVSYSLDVLDKLILQMLVLHAGIVRSTLIRLLVDEHGVGEQEAHDHIVLLTEAGAIKNSHGALMLRHSIRVKQGRVYVGGVP